MTNDEPKLSEEDLQRKHGVKILRVTERYVVSRTWGRDLTEMIHEGAKLALVLGRQGRYFSRGFDVVDGPEGMVYTTEVEVPK